MRRAARVAIVVLAGAGASAYPASADVSGPDESLATAFGPLALQTTYSGAFRSPDDIDYLSFTVPRAGTALRIGVTNTLTSCTSPDDNNCPVWATLVDGAGRQLGGEGSTAGTGEVDYGDSDSIDWTFPAAGNYFLVLESSGDLPTYRLRLDPSSTPPGSGRPGGRSGLIREFKVSSPQHGRRVSAQITFGSPISRMEAILVASSRSVRGPGTPAWARSVRHHLPAGPYRLTLWLNHRASLALRRLKRVRLRLRLSVRAISGTTGAATRQLTLKAR